jgi:hypothetical protein
MVEKKEESTELMSTEFKVVHSLRFVILLSKFIYTIFLLQYILNNYIFEFLNVQKNITIFQSIFLLLLIRVCNSKLLFSEKFIKKMIADIKN